jgi:hypothetical protein
LVACARGSILALDTYTRPGIERRHPQVEVEDLAAVTGRNGTGPRDPGTVSPPI